MFLLNKGQLPSWRNFWKEYSVSHKPSAHLNIVWAPEFQSGPLWAAIMAAMAKIIQLGRDNKMSELRHFLANQVICGSLVILSIYFQMS